MKRIGLFFLSVLLCRPVFAVGDACTNPDEYTIDKRCYVAEEQKKEKPYSAVVALVDDFLNVSCTGTIVKQYDSESDADALFVFTAKHCVDTDHDGVADSRITVKTQDDKFFVAMLLKAGAMYSEYSDGKSLGDWAIYKIKSNADDMYLGETNVIDVIGENFVVEGGFRQSNMGDVRLVGYGKLEIMSDAKISDFQQKYIKYLQDSGFISAEKDGNAKTSQNGFVESGAIDVNTDRNDKIEGFIQTIYGTDFMADTSLKESVCGMNIYGRYVGCQSWGGDSGGAVFDAAGKLIGIHSAGRRYIGGSDHAKASNAVILKHTIFGTRMFDAD